MWIVIAILLLNCSGLRADEQPPDQQVLIKHFEAGQQALQQGKLDLAVEEFKKLLELAPQIAEARLNLSLTYYLRGDYDLVVKELERIIKERPNLQPAYLFLGLGYLKIGAPSKAIPNLRKALQADPANQEARSALATAYLAKNDFRRAAKEYRTLFSHEQDKTEAWFQLGRHYFDMSKILAGVMVRQHRDSAWTSRLAGDVLTLTGNWEEAIGHYQQALQAEPEQRGLHASLGAAYLQENKFEEAAAEFRAELEREPFDEHALLGMVKVSLAQGDIRAAHEFARRLWNAFPAFLLRGNHFSSFSIPANQADAVVEEIGELPSGAAAEFLRLALYRASEQIEKAKEVEASLKKQVDLRKTQESAAGTDPCEARQYAACVETLASQPSLGLDQNLALGRAYLALGDESKASDAFGAALSMDFDNPESLYWLVRTYQALSSQCFRKVEEIAPNSWRVHQLRAEAHHLRQEDEQAITRYRAAIQLKPDDPELHESLGLIFFLDNNYSAAQVEFEKALQLDPARSRTQYLLGRLFVAGQKPAKAVPYLEMALRRDPTLVEARASLGKAYLRLDRPAEAAAELEKALDLDYYGDLHYSLFQAYRKLGKRELAMQVLARSEELRKGAFARDKAKLQRWIEGE